MKLSIIVPIYKSAIGMNTFLENIKIQTDQDFEVIFVIDSPTNAAYHAIDKSGIINKPNIKLIINSRRQFRSSAIWSALKIASGDYFCFASQTDILSKNYVKSINAKTAEYDPDVLEYGFSFKKMLRSSYSTKINTNTCEDPQTDPSIITKIAPYSFNKAFKRSIIVNNKYNLKFDVNSKFSVSEVFIIIQHVSKIIGIKEKLVSILVPKNTSISTLQISRSWKEIIDYAINHRNEEMLPALYFIAFKHMAVNLMKIAFSTGNKIQLEKQYSQVISIREKQEFKTQFLSNSFLQKKNSTNEFLKNIPPLDKYEKKLRGVK